MWLFTRYGFYSIACANGKDGSLDRENVMVRARVSAHLKNLQEQFPSLADAEILDWPDRDYRFRIIVPKPVWVAVLGALSEEQTWSNFKNEVAEFQRGHEGASDYIHALHEVWGVMNRLQRHGSGPRSNRR